KCDAGATAAGADDSAVVAVAELARGDHRFISAGDELLGGLVGLGFGECDADAGVVDVRVLANGFLETRADLARPLVTQDADELVAAVPYDDVVGAQDGLQR